MSKVKGPPINAMDDPPTNDLSDRGEAGSQGRGGRAPMLPPAVDTVAGRPCHIHPGARLRPLAEGADHPRLSARRLDARRR